VPDLHPKNTQAKLYKDSPLRLESGKEHQIQITVPRVLCVHLPIDPTNEEYAKDVFVLRSKDKSYLAKRTIEDNAIRRGRKLTLEFEDLLPAKIYSLFHERNDEVLGTFFTGQSYEDLFPDPTTNSPKRPKEILVEAPVASGRRLLFGTSIGGDDEMLAGDLETMLDGGGEK
jgi:hypothetical protein